MPKSGKRDAAELSRGCYEHFRKIIYGGGKGTHYFESHEVSIEEEVSRQNKLVFLAKDSAEYVLGFEDGNNGRQNFFVYLLGTDEWQRDAVTNEVLARLGCLRESGRIKVEEGRVVKMNRFNQIFGRDEPSFSYGDVTFDNRPYSGIRISLPIREVPEGGRGGLSEDLFVYFFEEVVKPATDAIERST